MTSSLLQQIEETEAKLAQLKRQAAGASCDVIGHRWKHMGGANAGCELGKYCGCSVAVHVCSTCKDCDYGDIDRPNVITGCGRRLEAIDECLDTICDQQS